MEVNSATIWGRTAPPQPDRFTGTTARPEQKFDEGGIVPIVHPRAAIRFEGCDNLISFFDGERHRGRGLSGRKVQVHALKGIASHQSVLHAPLAGSRELHQGAAGLGLGGDLQ
ncbi:MAG: hypothetical protein ACFB8W_06865 [Elainellaceae cyanobacterium]